MICGGEFCWQFFTLVVSGTAGPGMKSNKRFTKCRFPGTTFTDESQDLVLGDLNGYAVDCMQGLTAPDLEVLFQILGFNQHVYPSIDAIPKPPVHLRVVANSVLNDRNQRLL